MIELGDLMDLFILIFTLNEYETVAQLTDESIQQVIIVILFFVLLWQVILQVILGLLAVFFGSITSNTRGRF